MVTGKVFKILSAGAVVLSLGVTLAFATSVDEAITARQEFMKARVAALKPLISIMKGEAPYDPATIKTSLDQMNAAGDKVKNMDLFPPGSDKGTTVETWAKPEIWSDPQGFKAASDALDKAFAELAASTDEASFKAAFSDVGAACGGCHEKFRRPKG